MSPRALIAKGTAALTHDSTVSIAFAMVLIGMAFVAGRFSNTLERNSERITAVEQLANDTAQTLASVAAVVDEMTRRLDRERGG